MIPMKTLAGLLLLIVSAVAQTAKPPMSVPRVKLSSDGKSFQTAIGNWKKIVDLNVSDLPNAKTDEPLAIETTVKCTTLGGLAVDNEENNGAVAEQVPQEVIEAVPNAATFCLVRDLQSVDDLLREDAYQQIAAITDARVEVYRREYNRLVEKYNSLLVLTKDLQQQLLSAKMESAKQRRINNALAIYELMPKYTPPQTIRLQVYDCTQLPALCIH
jgi:hypothetical protein